MVYSVHEHPPFPHLFWRPSLIVSAPPHFQHVEWLGIDYMGFNGGNTRSRTIPEEQKDVQCLGILEIDHHHTVHHFHDIDIGSLTVRQFYPALNCY